MLDYCNDPNKQYKNMLDYCNDPNKQYKNMLDCCNDPNKQYKTLLEDLPLPLLAQNEPYIGLHPCIAHGRVFFLPLCMAPLCTVEL